MKVRFPLFLIQCFIVFVISAPASGQPKKQVKKATQIIKNNSDLLDDIHHLLVVFNETPEQNSATLVAMEKKNNRWIAAYSPIPAGIGHKGFAAPQTKLEGDQKSPTGLFRLGQLFCYDKTAETQMPFIQTTSDDKWIDDPNSPDYNRYVRGTTSAGSYENLKIGSDEYKYCMVIEYNTHPVVKGRGSAIFLHLSQGETPNPSSGCVVVTKKDMEWLLKWMNPKSPPSIMMGNGKVLIAGLKKDSIQN